MVGFEGATPLYSGSLNFFSLFNLRMTPNFDVATLRQTFLLVLLLLFLFFFTRFVVALEPVLVGCVGRGLLVLAWFLLVFFVSRLAALLLGALLITFVITIEISHAHTRERRHTREHTLFVS